MKKYIQGLNKWRRKTLLTNINMIRDDILAMLLVISKLEERRELVNNSSNFLYKITPVLSLFQTNYQIPEKGKVYTFLGKDDEFIIPQNIRNQRSRIPIKQSKDIKMEVCGLCNKLHPVICEITETHVVKFVICYEQEKLYEIERSLR